MGDLSAHFSKNELMCKCGCGGLKYDSSLIIKLEQLSDYVGNRPIYITSGYRCPKHSVAVGGYANDAHTKGLAVDCYIEGLSVEDVAEASEICGFTGIGLMNGAVHIDVRSESNYVNGHWFGDERTGNNNVKTFKRNPVKTYTKTGNDSKVIYTEIGKSKVKITIEEMKS